MKLSLPALETLAVIAYKQPVTAPEVMEIRGPESALYGARTPKAEVQTRLTGPEDLTFVGVCYPEHVACLDDQRMRQAAALENEKHKGGEPHAHIVPYATGPIAFVAG